MTPTTTLGFSGRRTARLTGISYRQLDYWARTDLVRPSLRDASGSGSLRLYSEGDLLTLALIRSLLDVGVKLERVRQIIVGLPDDWADLGDGFGRFLVVGRSTATLSDYLGLAEAIADLVVPATVVSIDRVRADVRRVIDAEGGPRDL